MKLAATLFALSLGFAAAAEAQLCATTCPTLIMPGATAVHLPFANWLYPQEAPVPVDQVSSPFHGSWNHSLKTYTPGPDFWRLGIDRFQVKLSGDPQLRTIVLFSGQPEIQTIDADLTSANLLGGAEARTPAGEQPYLIFESGPYGDSGSATFSFPDQGGTGNNGVVGKLVVNPSLPPLSGSTTTILQLGNIAHVDLLEDTQGNIAYRAIIDHPGLGCTGCTLLVPAPHDVVTITLALSADSWNHPSADRFRLRLEVAQNGLVVGEDFRPNLNPVPLDLSIELQAGLLAGQPANASLRIDSIEFSRLVPSQDDQNPAVFFENFGSGAAAAPWIAQGTAAVNLTTLQGEASFGGASSIAVHAFKDSEPYFEKRFRLIFDLDISQLNLAEGESVSAFSGNGVAVNSITKAFDVFVRKLNGAYIAKVRVLTDTGTAVSTAAIPLSTTQPTRVALHWLHAESGKGGSVKAKIGTTYAELQDIANPQRTLDYVNVGATYAALTSGGSRLIRFDNVTTVY